VWTDENQNGHEENRNTTLEYLHDLTITWSQHLWRQWRGLERTGKSWNILKGVNSIVKLI
jgi:hypothetical protein